MALVPRLKNIAIDYGNGVAVLKFNNPKTGNSVSLALLSDSLQAMIWANDCPEVRVIVQTGEGNYYSTGKELVTADPKDANPTGDQAEFVRVFRELNEVIIGCKKILIAAVNGPAVGYGTTSLGLYDLVYSVPDAYFFTPFMKWAFCAEGCSSVTFPKIMGRQKASALLLAGERMSAEELCSLGLITKIFPKQEFFEKVMAVANRIATYPPKAVTLTKNLIVANSRAELTMANIIECEGLVERFESKESKDAIAEFVTARKLRKSKL